jgi:hypothetical protein
MSPGDGGKSNVLIVMLRLALPLGAQGSGGYGDSLVWDHVVDVWSGQKA